MPLLFGLEFVAPGFSLASVPVNADADPGHIRGRS
jgi:hypothetical protein